MSADELTFRLRRIRAAIAAGEETDLTKVPAKVVAGRNFRFVEQDFRGGMSDEDIHNTAHQIIQNIANLRDNMIRWATANGKLPQKVWGTFNASAPIRVIQDLSNNEKHGYPPKDGGGNSRVAPKLTDVSRVMKVQGGTPGRWTGICTDLASGNTRKFGDGSAAAVVTGQVVDKDGKVIGDLLDIALHAVKDWEGLLAEYGVTVTGCGSIG